MNNSTAILLMAYGGPDSLDEVEPFVRDIRGGRPTPPSLVAEIRSRYAAIGGRSPLLEITRAQAAALQKATGLPVYVGMRHWRPRIGETVRQMAADGVHQAVALCLSPFYSDLSIGAYYRALDAALAETRAAIDFRRILHWDEEPLFRDMVATLARRAMDRFSPEEQVSLQLIFTAHSLPVRVVESGDPYPEQLQAAAEGIAARLELPGERWRLAYQSAGRSPEPWLSPSLEETIVELAAGGHRNLLVLPLGFVADHVEVLYDVDIEARKLATEHGARLERTPLPNVEPAFIAALQRIVQADLEG